jgi:UDP-N-acetylglucosamine--N-acetylmuramyl-(pentapeptide) pyrophosphoryl-undecaprenol N-acetylglucosamine transferase
MRILVVTGSSGGHIFPALSFLDTLKDRHKNIDTILAVPSRSIKNQIPLDTYKVKYLSFSPIEFSLNFGNLIAISRFLKGSLESLFLLLEFRPDIVVGFGTIDCVPLLLLAWIMRVKTLIHEQNVLPGRANRLLARFTDRIAVSFEETSKYLKDYTKKLILTGNPIRQELERIDKFKALSFFGFKEDKLTVLVMGGSQGSHRINERFLEAISMLPDRFRLQIIHITGIKDYASIKDRYRNLNVNAKVFSFLNAMQYAYSACDLVVSRAGATSITEIIFFNLPAILIPYPYAYKHQLNNARVLERRGCAFIINDEELDKNILMERIELLMDNPKELKDMRYSYAPFLIHNASDLLVNEVISLNYN